MVHDKGSVMIGGGRARSKGEQWRNAMKSKSKENLCLIFCFMLFIVYVHISWFMLCT